MMQPIVSIICLAYNHEKYIRDALDGFVQQQTNFTFEIIIHDDASTDNTASIIREYERKYPHIFKPIYQTENQYSKERGRVTRIVFEAAQGKYITLCEGDDYWTDPLKLQKQVDFMEENEDYSMCFHSVDILFNEELVPEIKAQHREYSIDELLLTKVAHTASFLFNKNYFHPNEFTKLISNSNVFGGDLFLALYLAEKGKVFGIRDKMAVYRKHKGGVTFINEKSLGVKHQERFIRQFIYIKNTFRTLKSESSSIKIADFSITVGLYYWKEEKLKALKYFFLAIYYRPELISKGLKKLWK